MCVCVYMFMFMCGCVCVCVRECVFMCVSVCMHVWVWVCMCLSVYVRVSVCTCISFTFSASMINLLQLIIGYNFESQPQQSISPYETYTSLATVPTTPLIQNSSQPHLQTSVQYNNQFQQMSSLSQPFQQSTYGIRTDSTGPPPLPSSPPPPVPQQQQQNPFDSF